MRSSLLFRIAVGVGVRCNPHTSPSVRRCILSPLVSPPDTWNRYSSTPLDDVQRAAPTDQKITSNNCFHVDCVFNSQLFGATAPLVVGNTLIRLGIVILGFSRPFSQNQLQSKNPLQYPVPLLLPRVPCIWYTLPHISGCPLASWHWLLLALASWL